MILAYKGISAISRAIRFVNWSDYSHIAYLDEEEGVQYEALYGTGVRRVDNVSQGHKPETPVDIFGVNLQHEQKTAIRHFMISQLGKPYDTAALFHFLSRRDERPEDQSKWFCSELVFAAFEAAGVHLLARIPRWRVYPGMIVYSPLLYPAGGLKTLP